MFSQAKKNLAKKFISERVKIKRNENAINLYPTHQKLDKLSCVFIGNFYHSVHGNHFVLDRKILETI